MWFIFPDDSKWSDVGCFGAILFAALFIWGVGLWFAAEVMK